MRKLAAILLVFCTVAVVAGFLYTFLTDDNIRKPQAELNDSDTPTGATAKSPPETVPLALPVTAPSRPSKDHALLLQEYEKLARIRDFRAAKALLPELLQVQAVHELAASRYRELLEQEGSLEDRIRVCGYLLLILNDDEVLGLWQATVSAWDASTPDTPRLQAWKKHEKWPIDEPAAGALLPFEEDTIAAESIAFWINSVLRSSASDESLLPIRGLLKHDVDRIDDPLLSLLITRVANVCLSNDSHVVPEGKDKLRDILAKLQNSGVSARLAYQIKVILAEPAADLIEFINRLNDAEGRKEAVQLLAGLLAEDYYVKNDLMLVMSALLLRFGAAEAGHIIADTMAFVPHIDDSTYVCRLAQVLGEGILKDGTDIDSQLLSADFIAKLVAECNVRRFFAETSANRRVPVLRDLPDGGLRVVRHLRRADAAKAPADRKAFDLFTRCVLIYELDVTLLQKNDEILDELALHQEFPFLGIEPVLSRLAHSDVQELLLYQESTLAVVRLLMNRAEPIIINDELNLSQCWNISQCIIHLSALRAILGEFDISPEVVDKMKNVIEPYRKALQRANAYDKGMEMYFIEVYQALDTLK